MTPSPSAWPARRCERGRHEPQAGGVRARCRRDRASRHLLPCRRLPRGGLATGDRARGANLDHFGRRDVLVNNAGMSPEYGEPADVSEQLSRHGDRRARAVGSTTAGGDRPRGPHPCGRAPPRRPRRSPLRRDRSRAAGAVNISVDSIAVSRSTVCGITSELP